VFAALRARLVERVAVVVRDVVRGRAALDAAGVAGDVLPWGTALPPAALLVNATSLGMTGQPPLDVDLSGMPVDTVVYDLVYAPLETPLLAAARARGMPVIDGLSMLIGQAAAAFAHFYGTAAPRQYDAELRALLTGKSL
jgi:shikimate dehydrogenase